MPILPRPLIILTTVAVLAALLPLPYGYYQLLRVLMFGVFAYGAFTSWKHHEAWLPWVMCGVAFIYNPLMPLHLGREIWMLVNLGTAGFLFLLLQSKRLEIKNFK